VIKLLYAIMFLAILCLYGPVFAQEATATIGATFSTAPRYVQCVDYVCRDDTGEIVGTLEQVEPEELNEVEAAAGGEVKPEEIEE
jgi:hypothetical protein